LQPSDEKLLSQIRSGSREAFDAFYARRVDDVTRRIHQLVRDAAVADDLTQETFLSVWRNSSAWRGAGTPAAWLYRIATNRALNYLRSRKRRPELSLDDETSECAGIVAKRLESQIPGPDAVAERAQIIGMVRQMIGELPESKREVMELVHTEDLSVAETAEILGIPSGTVKSRLHYGRLAIEGHVREFLGDMEGK
jgi:RNA polymerase sigma-70 factor (ECF subfamily)